MTDVRAPETQAAVGGPSRDAERAAFIARVTAGATHELRNYLAIVKESAGLVGDLLQATAERGPAPEKMEWALDRIQLQVRRGTDLTDALNRVMHGLDHPTETVALGAAVGHATLLAQRFARRSQCRLRSEEGSEVDVTVNVLDLYRVLVELVEWCVERLPEDGEVVMRPASVEARPAVGLETVPAVPFPELEEDALRRLEAVIEPLSARLEVAEGSVLLLFP